MKKPAPSSTTATLVEEDDDELSRGRRFLRWWGSRWGVVVSAVVLTVAVGVWQAPALYAVAKHWRAGRLIAQSEAADARGDEAAARDYLRQAGALLMRDPLVVRAVARHQARRFNPACLDNFEALAKAGAADATDWVEYTRVALRFGAAERFERGLRELSSASANSPVTLRLQSEALVIAGRWSEALPMARRAVAALGSQPGSDERLFLARVLLRQPSADSSGQDASTREAIALLGPVAARGDRVGVEALEELSALPRHPAGMAALARTPPSEVETWISQAGANPLAGDELRANLWTLRLAADSSRRPAIVAEFCQHYKSAPLPSRLAAVRWLNQRGEFSRAREMAAALKGESSDWFMVYLDAVAGLGDWAEVLREVEAEAPVPLPAAVWRVFRLRAQIELDQKPDVQFEWNLIRLALSPSDIPQQMYVAGYMEGIGFPQAASDTYGEVLGALRPLAPGAPRSLVAQRLQCYLGLLRTAGPSLPSKELADLMRRFAAEFPDFDEAQNDAVYLRLLVETNAAADDGTAARLLMKNPALLAYRTTAALAAFRGQHFREALQLYDGWKIEWETAPDRYRAVYAAVLHANGRREEANRVRTMIRADQLRAEEKALVAFAATEP